MATLSSIITPTNITTATNTQTLTNKTITGGIYNGTVGATTAAAGSFTTLAATGTITSTLTNGITLANISHTTTSNLIALFNTGNTCYLGTESSVGGSSFGGSTAYATLIGSQSNVPTQIFSNNALVGSFSSTGLAVTGATNTTTNFLDTANTDPVGNNQTSGFRAGGGYLISQQTNNYALSIGRAGTDGTVADIRKSGNTVGSISVTTTATAYNTSSDARLKTNVRSLTNSGAIIDALKPSLFDWKSGEKDSYGFIAQEAYAVFPQAVTKGDDDPDTITQRWAMDAGKFMPVAISELQSLRKRLADLESK